MIMAGIIGSTGYAGGELARLLLQRDDIEIKWYGSRSYIDQKYVVFRQVGDDIVAAVDYVTGKWICDHL